MILLVVFSFLVLSTVLVYFISHRYNLHSSPFLLGNFVGYISCALLGNLIFSIIMQDLGAVFADYGSLLGGGLGWTAAVVGMIMMSHPPKERLTERPFATDNSAVVSHSTIQIFWMLAIWGFIAVLLAIIFATVLDFVVFLIYGFLGFEITDLPILIARIIYVLVCVVISYFISIYLFQKKAQLIYQTLYPDHTVSASYTEQEAFVPEDKPKKRVWLWWLGGCGLLACLAFGAMAFFLFNLSNETSYPLNGNVAFPSAVKKGGDFDFVITLSNSTTEPIFINMLFCIVFCPRQAFLMVQV